ncbi:rRNA maturation factor [Babesia ovis]|uniref:rRNA maturation factor n=1 Tax=Babesia ovis TaxID=5869 RepID=A0A9W5T931_BABOV|nr:rRNA maturation factor [Babesia ovis]
MSRPASPRPLRRYIHIFSIGCLLNTVSSRKVAPSLMLELGELPDMNEILPEEEPPNLWDYSEPLVSKATTLENYPDPFVNPGECNRQDVTESYVCDPDRILTKVEADRIDELLSLQRHDSSHHCEGLGNVPFRLGVAIINWLPAEDMSTLSNELLQRWRLSHDKCSDGVLILYVIRHNAVVMSWGKGVEPILNAKTVSSISNICRTMLEQEKVAVAIERCTSFVTKRLTGVILPSQETPQMLVTLVIASVVAIFYGMIIVSIANEQQRHFVDESLIHNVCNLYRSELGFPDFSVDVLFVDPEEMTKYNLLHFGKRKPTDIISLADNSTYVRDQYHLNRSPQQVPEFRHLGEIIVCPNYLADEMRRDLEDCKGRADSHASLLNQQSNSGPFGVAVRMKKLTDLNLRFCYILAHGFLHLLGYDHVDDTDFERMLLEEDRLLDIFERFHASNSQTKLR